MKRNLIAFASFAVGFFLLYALTAQRGLGWGDSGEFQYRVLHCAGLLSGCESYATAHPLYVAFAKLVARTPFHVTLVSSFFGALAVGGFFLCTRRIGLTVLFGLSHMLWWLSCLAEVQTMNLAFTVFETLFLLRHLETGSRTGLVAALFLAGLHLNVHNFALLALPVYGLIMFRAGVATFLLSAFAWTVGASAWLQALVVRGPTDVLVGGYGAKVVGFLPSNLTVTAFNLALAAMSLAVPAAIAWWNRKTPLPVGANASRRLALLALLAVNALFFLRYFVPDQVTFLLPTFFYAYMLVSRFETRRDRTIALAAMQVLMPLMAAEVLGQLPRPEGRTVHPHRNDATYFAYPWKFNDMSADRHAAECGGVWTGYPERGRKEPK